MQKIHVERLRTLYSVIAGIPSSVIEMDGWRYGDYDHDTDKKFIKSAVNQILNSNNPKFDCGTAACALGWACAYPEFKKEGLKFKNGEPSFPGVEPDSWGWTRGWTDGYQVGAAFFGISYLEAETLFKQVGSHDINYEHKVIFLRRLLKLLVKKNIITEERAEELKAQEPLYN